MHWAMLQQIIFLAREDYGNFACIVMVNSQPSNSLAFIEDRTNLNDLNVYYIFNTCTTSNNISEQVFHLINTNFILLSIHELWQFVANMEINEPYKNEV